MKIKAKEKNGIVKVKALAKHIMLPYDAAKKKGVKANFITHLTATVDGKIVYELSSSQFISKNPIFKFQFKGTKGSKGTMTWKDLLGNTKTDRKSVV